MNNQLKCMDLDTGKAIVLADSVYDYTLSEETVCIICQDDSYLMLIDDRGNLISRINVEEFIEEGSLFRVASDEDYLYIAVLGKNSKLLVYDKKMEVLTVYLLPVQVYSGTNMYCDRENFIVFKQNSELMIFPYHQ